MNYCDLNIILYPIDIDSGKCRVVKILKKHKLDKYLHIFEENEIEYDDFIRLSDDNLRELNIPMGARMKIRDEIESIKEGGTRKSNIS